MKRRKAIKLVFAGACAAFAISAASADPSEIETPYLGQTTPGTVPERFAPGIVTSERWEYGGVFSPDMREYYVLKDDEEDTTWLHLFRHDGGIWFHSVLSPREGQPFISPDGKTMHLGRRYKERVDGEWSEIKRLGEPFDDIRIMRLTASANGTYYFDEVGSEDGDGRIRYARMVDGNREAPRLLGEEINTGKFLAHPFIAPDESYLLFDGERDGGFGDSDIYVSFRMDDGSWGEAINLGETINTGAWEAAASVTPDGEYLFFNRDMGEGNVDIFWVDASVIEDLRPAP